MDDRLATVEEILLRLRAERDAMQEAAKQLDDLLLRLAFDGGAIGDERVNELGIDPWGTLSDFRQAFGLRPNFESEEEWARSQARKDAP